ncbi:hypothetical protein BT69DRAFT_1346420 [Atractiella rhizophila]|nr:hypothetical protein BT69DRAFT_1346420 [Atractiella rhizophila]
MNSRQPICFFLGNQFNTVSTSAGASSYAAFHYEFEDEIGEGYDDGYTNDITRDLMRNHWNESIDPIPPPSFDRRPSLAEFGNGPLPLSTQSTSIPPPAARPLEYQYIPPTRPNTPISSSSRCSTTSMSSFCLSEEDLAESDISISRAQSPTLSYNDLAEGKIFTVDLPFRFENRRSMPGDIGSRSSSFASQASSSSATPRVASPTMEDGFGPRKPKWLPKSYSKQWGKRRGAICMVDSEAQGQEETMGEPTGNASLSVQA